MKALERTIEYLWDRIDAAESRVEELEREVESLREEEQPENSMRWKRDGIITVFNDVRWEKFNSNLESDSIAFEGRFGAFDAE